MPKGCAFGPCGRGDAEKHEAGMAYDSESARWVCYLCVMVPRLFATPTACGRVLNAEGDTCRLVAGHPSWQQCKTRKMLDGRDKPEDTSTRDGAPKLAAEKVHTTVSRKKTRQGPLYVPPERRV